MSNDALPPELDKLPIEHALLMCFDLETTGVSLTEDRIVQLAVSYFHQHRVVQQHTQIFNPERPIPEGASAVHGIYQEHVEGQPTLADFLPRLEPHFRGEILKDHPQPVLVGYNLISFDIPLFKSELKRIGADPHLIDLPTLDLIVFTRWYLRHRSRLKLESICEEFGVSLEHAHNALFDAKACGLLIPHLIKSGYMPSTIGEALRAQARFSAQLAEEHRLYKRWLYRDRTTNVLTLGQGKHHGTSLALIDPGYCEYCLRKMSDLPTAVRDLFTARVEGKPIS